MQRRQDQREHARALPIETGASLSKPRKFEDSYPLLVIPILQCTSRSSRLNVVGLSIATDVDAEGAACSSLIVAALMIQDEHEEEDPPKEYGLRNG